MNRTTPTGTDAATKVRSFWWIDAALFSSAALAILSGIYFLFLPSGGYQGGRNPFYGVTIIFPRDTWDILHTWSGVIMIAIAAIHLLVHWSWVVGTIKRIIGDLSGQCTCKMSSRLWSNLIIDSLTAVSFSLSAISGLYFLFFSHSNVTLLLSRNAWDLLHTWSSVVFIITALIHFAIHWKWIVVVTGKMLRKDKPCRKLQDSAQVIG
ncbi:MAG: DUF4405 domain-containing protein [Anaerolineae bacterium]|nr:DUF4405 domain-containing protein [Anaerolineae bacterium]